MKRTGGKYRNEEREGTKREGWGKGQALYILERNMTRSEVLKPVAELEGGPSRLRRLPPLGDGLTPSLTVMLANAEFRSFYCKAWYSEYAK